MECSNHFATVLETKPGFDFLNNVRFEKESILALQNTLATFFVPFFDAYHYIPLKNRKRDEMKLIMSTYKSDYIMSTKKHENRIFALIDCRDTRRFQLFDSTG